jgi:hypothetical protein
VATAVSSGVDVASILQYPATAATGFTAWRSVLFERLIEAQVVKNLPVFSELRKSFPCSQEPGI